MEPILLIHGYSSEGKDVTVTDIYGTLPKYLAGEFGENAVKEINLSRWISLDDGVSLDDVSFAMERALQEEFSELLKNGFHVIIHSTGALVVRNWLLKYSTKPSPIKNLIYLAGASFGSGLAHVGKGQLARWGRLIFNGTGRGMQVLKELEFGSWKTVDMQRSFLNKENDLYKQFKVQEFCMSGSQTLQALRIIPIRYIKEDSSDSTVRTSSCNLNYNYISVQPKKTGKQVDKNEVLKLVEKRLDNKRVQSQHYEYDYSCLCRNREPVPFAILYETAHFGEDIGILEGKKNREKIVPLIRKALRTPYDLDAYRAVAKDFNNVTKQTFQDAAKQKWSITEWNKQAQYEGHVQLIFRLRDQFGGPIEHFDITINSKRKIDNKFRLEDLIEDKHSNEYEKGTITFYLRTQEFDKENKRWIERLDTIMPTEIEITGHEALTEEINYIPLRVSLSVKRINELMQTFRTTIFDIELMRLPSRNVFKVSKYND